MAAETQAPPPPNPAPPEAADAKESFLKLNLAMAELFGKIAIERQKGVSDLTLLALRTLLLFNGGAIVALFTVLGHGGAALVSAGTLNVAFEAFSVGIFATMVAVGAAFHNQNAFFAFETASAHLLYHTIGAHLTNAAPPPPLKPPNFALKVTRPLAIGLCWVSVAAFGFGSWSALQALKPAAAMPAVGG